MKKVRHRLAAASLTVLILSLTYVPARTQAVVTPDTMLVPVPVFENDSSNFTNSGSIKLSWRSQAMGEETAIANFELQRATKADFSDAQVYYRGPDLATYVSGLAEGSYRFRVREVRDGRALSAWSAPVEVVVQHHSLSLAFTLFGIGGLVFALTVIVVVRGASRTRDPDRMRRHAKQEVRS